MFGLKIFVRVQTFRRVPPVLPRNFCHPALNWILGKAILNRILNESFFGKIQTLNWIRLGIAHPYLPVWKKDQCCMIDTPLIWIPSSQLRLLLSWGELFLWQRWTFWSKTAFPILSKPPSLKAVKCVLGMVQKNCALMFPVWNPNFGLL